ncbi:uncharacterized protein I206_102996 [Kwoniella pini CBS 10737]|uniref:Major facilitator superfamily (MFS) profile domain-containing protein n=1 Tax=Kwoniella pini CBS 10737 TaxID=1296096 RepID=A0A1B9I6X0_9TREE|nr:uncharacterized protein I206_03349 [Kwoniella pini CBS 10737]OCF51282.1 hypothetical protein I206_03349 [Kwoniella pini CBS 10737]
MTFSKGQLAVLLLARVVEPIGYTILFPYVNQMVEDLLPDVPKSSVGKYSGLVESIFALSSVLFMYRWGKLSDRIGRKPVILGGLCGVAFAHVMFGLSKSYKMAVAARFLSGLLCGNASVMRAVLGEVSTPETESLLYPLWTTCWDVACVLGPTLGALLQHPATQYPHSKFATLPLLRQYPYLLPSALIATLALFAAVLVATCLEETNPAIKARSSAPVELPSERTRLLPEEPIDTIEALPEKNTFIDLIAHKPLQQVLLSIFLLTLSAMSFDAGFALFAYSVPSLGGIDLAPRDIAACLSVKGALSIAFNLLVFPVALRRFKMRPLYRLFSSCWILVFMIPPIMNAVVMKDGDNGKWVADGSLQLLWLLMLPLLLLYVFGDLAFPLNMMALNAASPSSASLGAINGISLVVSALARSVGPAIFGLLYGIGAEHRMPIVWVVFGGIALLGALHSATIRGDADKVEERDV